MASSTAAKPVAALTLRRVFNAPIEKVFAAWTQAEVLANWFGPEGFIVNKAEIDLRVGGKYLIILQSPAAVAIQHFGEYVEVTPPERLVFTWVLENQACPGGQDACAETLVSIDFRRRAQSTEIQLIHERLPDKAAYDGHVVGWTSTFDCFGIFLSK